MFKNRFQQKEVAPHTVQLIPTCYHGGKEFTSSESNWHVYGGKESLLNKYHPSSHSLEPKSLSWVSSILPLFPRHPTSHHSQTHLQSDSVQPSATLRITYSTDVKDFFSREKYYEEQVVSSSSKAGGPPSQIHSPAPVEVMTLTVLEL